MWSEIIGTLFWSFALKAYENTLNIYDLDSELKSPAIKFAKYETLPSVVVKYTFGCSVYVLTKMTFKLLEDRLKNGIIGLALVSILDTLLVVLVLSHLLYIHVPFTSLLNFMSLFTMILLQFQLCALVIYLTIGGIW